ncbi:hypothetical protein BKH41_00095 [Helicobacter sp. 12S02232-10]|uniref:DUF2018 family protein n=1 Tax=Helicobacter sp. 12S02232-10 TaxID=1476197 RepID=UPI000BA738A5|nr:DUF2018 family protein [Helicobacter sp. 12S02232-10]PAF49748.1 hypothetical protein BKH41_00095 [Helicobacter sp. 12S02232-10]
MWEKFDDLEMLEGSPIEKWKDIIFNASRNLSGIELERMLELQAIYEVAFEEFELENKLKELYMRLKEDVEFQEKVKHQKNNIAIESMAKILSENE